MSEQKARAAADAADKAERTRQRSSIAFPYNDFDDAKALAETIHANVGSGTCDLSQLAAWSKQSSKSSGFRMQVAAARMFGVIESDGSDSYRMTTLGRQLIDPNTARKAKIDAFLNVPLFSALYKNHKEGILPPMAALEREIASLGVSEKQKDRARQVFERSADQTGFFESDKTRLVMPGIPIVDPPPPPPGGDVGETGGANGGGGGNGGAGNLALDPLLMALLRKIPASGEWPADKRVRWFKTFAMNVSQIYDPDDDPVELTINQARSKGTE